MFSVIDAVLFRPLDAKESDRLVRVYETNLHRDLKAFSASISNRREGLMLALAGAATGTAAALFVSRSLDSVLFGISTHDPAIFAVVPWLCWRRP
jgi:hypothetical protein